MPSLVLELQEAALDTSIRASTLLLRAKTVAVKLRLNEALQWIDSESRGYYDTASLPEYRRITTTIRVFNPYRGWEPVTIKPDKLRDLINDHVVVDSISYVEAMIEQTEREGGNISRKLPQHTHDFIQERLHIPMRLDAKIELSAFKNIVDAVRERILSWALALEEQGILGSGMTFSERDRERAHQTDIRIDRIDNFAGSIGGTFGTQSITAEQQVNARESSSQ